MSTLNCVALSRQSGAPCANINSTMTPTFAGAGQLRDGLSTIFAGLLHSSTAEACPSEASLDEGFADLP
jgi:hypothetical protein